MAVYKFRVISRNSLKLCAFTENHFENFFPDHEKYVRWIANFPREASFPAGLFFMPKRNLSDSIVRFSRLQADVSVQQTVNQHCVRIVPADFIQSVTKAPFLLCQEDMSAKWVIPTFRSKRSPSAWVTQVLQLRAMPNHLPDTVFCISQIPVEKWSEMTCDEIRNTIARPGKRFVAALRRTKTLLAHMQRYSELVKVGTAPLPHLVTPSWGATFACYHCRKTVPVGMQPWALQVNCQNAQSPADALFHVWNHELQQQTLLEKILLILKLPHHN